MQTPDRPTRSLRRFLFLASLALLSFVDSGCTPKSSSTAASSVIREVTASGHRFGVADVFLGKSTLRLLWKKADGTRIGTFEKLKQTVSTSGERLIFATNAGIFDGTFTPCGLYVQDGGELVPLNLNTGTGNFYMKPNGVFLLGSRGAEIIESSAYQSLPAKPMLATQSGPLLVSHGQINPRFAADSSSRRIRSGIGVISPSHIVFVISRDRVTFYEFALFFETNLQCGDALYLDGEISRFYPDPAGTSDRPEDFAGMFAVTEHE
jgi:uncharacterized protein YigE (DUF2233 family)